MCRGLLRAILKACLLYTSQTARAEVEKEEAAKEPEEKTQEEPPAAGDGEHA